MAISRAQQLLNDYHSEIAGHGHNMFLFHRDWHRNNPNPPIPTQVNANWGSDLSFGSDFFQMHHEMVSAADGEPKRFMMHSSLMAWYRARAEPLPPAWNSLQPILPELSYTPDLAVFPPEIGQIVQAAAQRAGVTPELLLTRKPAPQGFSLPKWFTLAGSGPGESTEPYTGARKLSDFVNVNQLGCCMVFPHNEWHGHIGGAMGSPSTAIADPIFYWGVHRQIDDVYQAFVKIDAQRLELAQAGHFDELSQITGARAVSQQFDQVRTARRIFDLATSRAFNRGFADATTMDMDEHARYIVHRGETISITVTKSMSPFIATFPDSAGPGMPLRQVSKTALEETQAFAVAMSASVPFTIAIPCTFAGAPQPGDRYDFKVEGSESGTGTPPPPRLIPPPAHQISVIAFQPV